MKNQKGFSLIELLVTLAILAILASFAYSSYSNQVQKSRRTDVKEALLKAAALQERFFLSNTPNRYAEQAEINEIGGATTPKGYYSIRVLNNTATGQACDPGQCFTISGVVDANVNAVQVSDDECQMFTIDNFGRKRAYDSVSTDFSGTESENCW